MNDEGRKMAWATASQRFLEVARDDLIAHGVKVANGERGVLVIEVDADWMTRVLDEAQQTGTRAPLSLLPTWQPADEFIAIVKEHHSDRDAWQRWGRLLNMMEPTRDVALYLHNNAANDDGHHFEAFLFLTDLTAFTDAQEVEPGVEP